MTDPMTAITEAVELGRAGDTAEARRRLLALWPHTDEPMHRCALAHYLADLYDDPAQALTWDLRALDAAGDRMPAGFYPSLHLNLADCYRRLNSFEAAAEHIAAAREHSPALGDDEYGAMIRGGIARVARAISGSAPER